MYLLFLPGLFVLLLWLNGELKKELKVPLMKFECCKVSYFVNEFSTTREESRLTEISYAQINEMSRVDFLMREGARGDQD